MYCSTFDFKQILPPTVTLGDTNIGTPSPGNSVTKRDKITPDEAIQYIRLAQQEIDSRLRPFYTCPLRRTKQFETDILNNISAGSSININVWDSSVFYKGDSVRLQSKDAMELSIVTNIPDDKTITVNTVLNNYIEGSKVSIVKFPDPIPLIAARFAVSFAFDALFTAQQAPDVSEYGKEQRKLALNSMDNILTGSALLVGQEHTGRRFVKSGLLDSWNSPSKDIQFGREKS